MSFTFAALALQTVCASASEGVGLIQVRSDLSSGDDGAPGLCPGQTEKASVEQAFSQLALVHIPRTGGTSIEDCTKHEESEARWGALQQQINGLNTQKPSCYRQHVPPSRLDSDYYIGKETFCVVRHPYARLISQHGWACGTHGPPPRKCTKDDLNDYLLEKLKEVQRNPYDSDCHFLPASAYVFGYNTTSNEVDATQQGCKNVLRFEDGLQDSFNELMQAHGHTYRMEKIDPNTQSPHQNGCNFVGDDLSDEVVQMANEIFRQDFELLEYTPRTA